MKTAICLLLDRAAVEIIKKGGVLKFEEVEIFGRSEVDKEEFEDTFCKEVKKREKSTIDKDELANFLIEKALIMMKDVLPSVEE